MASRARGRPEAALGYFATTAQARDTENQLASRRATQPACFAASALPIESAVRPRTTGGLLVQAGAPFARFREKNLSECWLAAPESAHMFSPKQRVALAQTFVRVREPCRPRCCAGQSTDASLVASCARTYECEAARHLCERGRAVLQRQADGKRSLLCLVPRPGLPGPLQQARLCSSVAEPQRARKLHTRCNLAHSAVPARHE